MTRTPGPDRVTKQHARVVTRELIRTGALVPTPCRDCGAARVDAHHTDYADPRAVAFLCRRCHALAHRALAAGRHGTPESRELGRRLLEAIGQRSQEEVAALLGIDQASVSRLLTGAARPGRKVGTAIARAFPTLRTIVFDAYLS